MCKICELQAKLHIEYIQKRDSENKITDGFDYHQYKFLDEKVTKTASEANKRIKNGQAITPNDLASILFISETQALAFAEQHINREHVKNYAQFAKTIEDLRTALTLIQSKAVISGDETIKKIALEALENQSFRFGQSAKDLEEIIRKIDLDD